MLFLKHGLEDGCVSCFSNNLFQDFSSFFFLLAGEMWVTNGEGIREGEIIWAA